MIKERLEEVIELMCERYHDYLVTDNIKRAEVNYKSYLDYKEIIKSEFEKQAERVQELEELVEDYKTVNKELHDRRKKLRKQNKRYRKVIEEAIEYANSPKILTSPAGIEKILSKALEGRY